MRLTTLIAVVVFATSADAGYAQVSGIEAGTSMGSLVLLINHASNTTTTFAVPTGGVGVVNPAFYVSVPITSHVSVQPRIGFLLYKYDFDTSYLLNLTGEAAYYFNGSAGSSPFVSGSAGLLRGSSRAYARACLGAGAGYRLLYAGRVAIRLEGNFTHFTDDGGNAVGLGVSLGGVFGRRK